MTRPVFPPIKNLHKTAITIKTYGRSCSPYRSSVSPRASSQVSGPSHEQPAVAATVELKLAVPHAVPLGDLLHTPQGFQLGTKWSLRKKIFCLVDDEDFSYKVDFVEKFAWNFR